MPLTTIKKHSTTYGSDYELMRSIRIQYKKESN